MNDEIREILDIFKQVDLEADVGGCSNCPRKKDKNRTCIGCLNNAKDKLLDYITNLQKENEEIKVENEKLTQLWLNSQEKRRKAIEYLEQPYRDNFDYSKAELLNILQNGDNSND